MRLTMISSHCQSQLPALRRGVHWARHWRSFCRTAISDGFASALALQVVQPSPKANSHRTSSSSVISALGQYLLQPCATDWSINGVGFLRRLFHDFAVSENARRSRFSRVPKRLLAPLARRLMFSFAYRSPCARARSVSAKQANQQNKYRCFLDLIATV